MLNIEIDMEYGLGGPTDVLLFLEAANVDGQIVKSPELILPPASHTARIPGEDDIGERIWMQTNGPLQVTYRTQVEVTREDADLSGLASQPPHLMDAVTTRYLFASRFCPADEFQSFVNAEFGNLAGGARIAAMRDWIQQAVSYVPGSSGPHTTAVQTFIERQGICRDFAHLMVTLSRASGIPARMVSVYSPDVTPPDFHAVAQIWLEDGWHLVDATGMGSPSRTAIVGVGLDAAEIAFLTLYGNAVLNRQVVSVTAAG
ncbi:transglutaminase family protein [Pelagovum pacificum]|uniref:Transglutaminase family protein n=2 Tax=Pelagovum pacificum TaxID=2588711 RepID=A0A5C5GHX5_9RHOB|nr:transglutaminase family protein [Pelagovum pacificum]TNY34372.1 transglutaminase family protein [Pelagovum pacificum]